MKQILATACLLPIGLTTALTSYADNGQFTPSGSNQNPIVIADNTNSSDNAYAPNSQTSANQEENSYLVNSQNFSTKKITSTTNHSANIYENAPIRKSPAAMKSKKRATNENSFYARISAGAVFNTGKASNSVSLNPTSTYTAKQDQHYSTAGLFGLGAGYQFKLARQFLLIDRISLGLDAYYQTKITGKGGIYLNNTLKVANYKVDLDSKQLFLDSKINFADFAHLSPFIMLGIGYALNTANGYSETPTTGGYQPSHYGSKSTSNFAYQLGVGIDYRLTTQTAIALSYMYVNAGKAHLATGSGPAGIKPPTYNLHSNDLVLSLQTVF